MASGLRVEVVVGTPGDCPVAAVSADAETPITSVSRASIPDSSGRVAEEFTVEGTAPPTPEEIDEVGAYDVRTVYRFRRSRDRRCVCERIESFGYPVSEIHAVDGALHASFHAPDLETVREIVTALRERFSNVRLRKLTRSDGCAGTDLVLVDRGRLTARQREVLRTAYELGYFDHPKGTNAGDVADELGISPSTFSEHLAAAQRKILDAISTS
ncbi:helix-turn-helix domain-containing protein [Halegenticoccus tardaugens]|uniref:helix-turn-helix domain-containing protein n=1 Tax=Halegenticoccus tardaugens TaxID=2071624 RepID=UPI00100B8DC0|nr:helix-turn-helix domain-containing protein [Halegenticoccus tardaugens]